MTMTCLSGKGHDKKNINRQGTQHGGTFVVQIRTIMTQNKGVMKLEKINKSSKKSLYMRKKIALIHI